MPLLDLTVSADGIAVPADVRAFLREADRRIERFERRGEHPAFVPGDYPGAYRTLAALSAAGLAPGNLLCEWGSGFGVVACLAALLDYDACGVEIEPELVSAARRLATDYELPVEFACASFIPLGAARDGPADEFAWLTTDESEGGGDLGLSADDFDVIFAYPWPDEAEFIEELFERHGAVGAILVTYEGDDGFRLRRKTSR